MLSSEERERYARQLNLPQWGKEQQLALKNASVLVVGAGALGCPVITYLSAAGIGKIGIVDGDIVDRTNLHRQVIYQENHIGAKKAEVARQFVLSRNSNCAVSVFETRINSENAFEISKGFDIIVDGTDNFPTRYLINDLCVLSNKVNVHGSITQFSGQVSVFNGETRDGRGPNYRDLYPVPPDPTEVLSCEEGGVLGVLPGVIGNLMAIEVIKIITGIGRPLIGELMQFSALDSRMINLKFSKDDSNPLSGASPIQTKLIDYNEFCGIKNDDKSITWKTALEILQSEAAVLVDVREQSEYADRSIDGALNLALSLIKVNEVKVPNTNLLLYCGTGKRSLIAQSLLKEQGHDNCLNVLGGFEAYTSMIKMDNVK